MSAAKTIKDIAKLANVSQSTVSKALNDRPDIGLETKEHILKIVEQHNFLPNASGKALKSKVTENIGVIFRRDDNPLSSNPFYSRVLEGIEAELAFNDYNLVLHLVPEHKIPVLPKMVRERHVDGVVLVGIKHEAFVRQLQHAHVPVILIDPKADIANCPQVRIDNENGAFLATQHLIQCGHERIGFISGELSRLSFKQRLDGYAKALKYHNLAVEEDLIKAGGLEEGYQLTKALLQMSPRPTAVFAANDINAIYGYKAINEFGLRIPDDISVVGFDDIDLSKMAIPPLTTVRVYKEELGSVAVRNLRQILHEEPTYCATTIIPVRLIKRESVRNIKRSESSP
ncbi:MAG: LacI family DNA-binding transcriptional regulator [bacterium]